MKEDLRLYKKEDTSNFRLANRSKFANKVSFFYFYQGWQHPQVARHRYINLFGRNINKSTIFEHWYRDDFLTGYLRVFFISSPSVSMSVCTSLLSYYRRQSEKIFFC